MIKQWIQRNLRNIIVVSFIIPILLVAIVSITHVTTMYGLSNPLSWSLYLSVGVEIAALSALAAISVRMGKFVYFPFVIVTIIQFLGNMYSTYTFIDETSKGFTDWVNFINPFVEMMGVDKTDLFSHKRILSFFTGGLLPFISLTFVHMLVVFTNKEAKIIDSLNEVRENEEEVKKNVIDDSLNIKDLDQVKEAKEEVNEIIDKEVIKNDEVTDNSLAPISPINEEKILTYTK